MLHPSHKRKQPAKSATMKRQRLSNFGSTPPRYKLRSLPRATFQSLPTEVRCMIWDYARARCISIDISIEGIIHSRSPSPITCRINRESRAETMKHYKAYTLFHIDCEDREDELGSYPFFDPAVDSVLLLNPRKRSGIQEPPLWPPQNSHADFEYVSYEDIKFPWLTMYFDIVQSLHIPTIAWYWDTIKKFSQVQSPRRRFNNLRELVFEGGKPGLETKEDVVECLKAMECYYKTADDVGADIRIPRLVINMPGHDAWNMMFYGTTTENSIRERKSLHSRRAIKRIRSRVSGVYEFQVVERKD